MDENQSDITSNIVLPDIAEHHLGTNDENNHENGDQVNTTKKKKNTENSFALFGLCAGIYICCRRSMFPFLTSFIYFNLYSDFTSNYLTQKEIQKKKNERKKLTLLSSTRAQDEKIFFIYSHDLFTWRNPFGEWK